MIDYVGSTVSLLDIGRRPRPGAAQGGAAIIVKCPKCREDIRVTGFPNDEAVRCGRCAYPLVCRSDLLAIVEACGSASGAEQLVCAVRVLTWLTDHVPEAASALGSLAARHTLPMSDRDRWSCLAAAWARGDRQAQEWLDKMCQSNPETYKRVPCKSCGAPRYFIGRRQDSAPCVYCQS